jgi:hypothetical protein
MKDTQRWSDSTMVYASSAESAFDKALDYYIAWDFSRFFLGCNAAEPGSIATNTFACCLALMVLP